jgi:chromosomal replication initiation ATPase DnaA
VYYEEIAERLGYKNHSGVIKRIQAITKEFIKYEEEQW